VYLGALAFNSLLTVFWLTSVATGQGTMIFSDYRITWASLRNVAVGVLVLNIAWGFVWWGIKAALLRWHVGFTKEERRDGFSSRMDRSFDVASLTAKYSERRIRIVDMIGRRGRFMTLVSFGFYSLYLNVLNNPQPNFAIAFAGDNLFEGLATSWIFLGVFYLNGFWGATFYGPQSRVMDGYVARANCLLISTLWTAFKFVMLPLSLQLAATYPRQEFAAVFGLIWGSYIAADACSEISARCSASRASRCGASVTSIESRWSARSPAFSPR
jgi:hypothetical protein